jgi:predicted nucleic-acid-binding Zn-ribbon protein
MSEPQPTQCPKCGSREREYGRLKGFAHSLFVPRGFWRFTLPKPVMAIACLRCGNIELVLEGVALAHAAADEPERPAVEHPSLLTKDDG